MLSGATAEKVCEMPGSKALATVARGDLCAGCGGCALVAAGAVEMRMARRGFLRPVEIGAVTDEQERVIARICPGLGQAVAPAGAPGHPLWGGFRAMHSGHATDPALRFAASSGGVLSALLVHLVETGAVDAVVETGAATDPPWANAPVRTTTAADIRAAAGSRYAPSAPLAGLGDLIDGDGRYAFVGKPCDVAALRALAAEDARVQARFPVLISFFCAGVPSQNAAEALVQALGATPETVRGFRYRGHGWPGRATATLADGSAREMSYQESWGAILSKQIQHRCKICADGTGTAADIVCADAWDSDAGGYPVFEERDGVSLIVTRTATGDRLLEGAVAAGRVVARPFDVAGLAAIQPGQTRRRQALLGRIAALRLLARPVPRYRGLGLVAAARGARPGWVLRNFLGMVRRTLAGRG